LAALLNRVGEREHRQRLAQELARWRSGMAADAVGRVNTSVHALHDLRLSREAGHFLTDAQEPWVNSALACLRQICWAAHRESHRCWTAQEVAAELGNGRRSELVVEAVRCNVCDYSQVRAADVEAAIAAPLVRRAVAELSSLDGIEALLTGLLRMDLPGADEERSRVTYLLEAAGAVIDKRVDAVQRCPRCKGFGLRPARWRIAEDGATRCTS
jgi:predicted Zn-ribbon and HTH transcriptional regulator